MNFSLKPKDLTINSGPVRYSFLFILAFLFMAVSSVAQVERPIKNPAGTLPYKKDSVNVRPDSVNVLGDTLIAKTDTLRAKNDSIPPRKGDIETTINYTAKDSIRASMDNKKIWLYGDAKIVYGLIELEAEEIVIDYANSTISANGIRDSLGNRIGYPIFKNGPELYETKGIVYNFKTKRARITEVVTQQGEGFLHSEAAFKNEKNEILSVKNSYTTCNLEHPHFRIRATKTKAIPNDKIVAGPFYIEFNDIPLPAGFLFGMFPAQRESKSGILFPSYGEERRRGFNLRNGGYFFDINEYIKLSLTGDIYSKGGHALYVNSNYMKRYAYNGQFAFAYSKNKLGTNIEDHNFSNDFRLTWSHSPQSKGTGRFSASVNAATATFNKNNNLMFGQTNTQLSSSLSNISTKLNSNVSYNKRFGRSPFSAGINFSHTQDIQTKLVDLPFPNLTVNMTNIYPFQRKGKTGPLDNFSVGYSMTATNRITNNLGKIKKHTTATDSIAPFTLDNVPIFIRNSKNGIRHSMPLSYSFKALKFFTMSPSVSYEERWYFQTLNWKYNKDSTSFVADTTRGFSRIGNYSFSTGLTTRVYGMYFIKNKNSRVKAIRHIINPSVSFGYTPDFSTNPNYFQRFRDKSDTTKFIYKDRHEGYVYGGSSLGRSGSLGFGIGNNLEMKVKGKKDSVERKVMLLNNLSFASSYNLLADSFALAPITIAANSSILNNMISINLASTVDPYRIDRVSRESEKILKEKRYNDYAWKSGSLGRITSATLALTTNLNPAARKKQQDTKEKVAKSNIPESEKQHILENPNAYIDFDIPWSLNFGYNLNYSHALSQKSAITQTVQMSGDISLSKKWKINYSTGYHFEAKEFTQTSITVARDLHCWQMNLLWVPFGRFQSYNFTIAVKASILKDLKMERRKAFLDNIR